MTTLPTSPFPELRPLEEKRKVPSLAELLSGGEAFPIDPAPVSAPPARPALKIHRMPRNGEAASAKAISVLSSAATSGSFQGSALFAR